MRTTTAGIDRIEYSFGRELRLFGSEGQLLLRYHFACEEPDRKPFLHPLCTPRGRELTLYRPSDHVWHRGLWFSWKFINKVNYWEEEEPRGGEGITEFEGPESLVCLPDGTVRLAIDLTYRPPGEKSVLRESRALHFRGIVENHLVIDWESEFAAEADLTLDRTPITPETPWGGYAGLGWRASRSMTRFQFLDAEGRTGEAAGEGRSPWLDLSGLMDGSAAELAGVALFDHPLNPGHPTNWKLFGLPEFGYANAALLYQGPMRLKKGERLTLRYRVATHDGPPMRSSLDRLSL